MSQAGAVSINASDGKIFWKHLWKGTDRILQPALIEGSDYLLPGSGNGMQRISIEKADGKWITKTIWSTKSIRPSWNDSVVHNGYAFGFHNKDLACLDLKDGKRLWKGGKYAGHLLLLKDQGIIIVLSEQGELALVEAKPDGFNELARIKAIEGKTWNLPAMVGDILLVRNSQEMAAFRLETI
jgi:outer membrane protein assembly factor BamB